MLTLKPSNEVYYMSSVSACFCFVAMTEGKSEPADVGHSPVPSPLVLMLPQVRAVFAAFINSFITLVN